MILWLSWAIMTIVCNQQRETVLLFLLPLCFATRRPPFVLVLEIVWLVYLAETFLFFWLISQHVLVPMQGRNSYGLCGLGGKLVPFGPDHSWIGLNWWQNYSLRKTPWGAQGALAGSLHIPSAVSENFYPLSITGK